MSIYVRSVAYGPPSLEAIADRVPRRVDNPFAPSHPGGFIFLVLLRDRRTDHPFEGHREKESGSGKKVSRRKEKKRSVPAAIYELPIRTMVWEYSLISIGTACHCDSVSLYRWNPGDSMRSQIIGRFAFNGIIYLRFDRLDVKPRKSISSRWIALRKDRRIVRAIVRGYFSYDAKCKRSNTRTRGKFKISFIFVELSLYHCSTKTRVARHGARDKPNLLSFMEERSSSLIHRWLFLFISSFNSWIKYSLLASSRKLENINKAIRTEIN